MDIFIPLAIMFSANAPSPTLYHHYSCEGALTVIHTPGIQATRRCMSTTSALKVFTITLASHRGCWVIPRGQKLRLTDRWRMQDSNAVQQSRTYEIMLAELILKSLTTVNLKVALWKKKQKEKKILTKPQRTILSLNKPGNLFIQEVFYLFICLSICSFISPFASDEGIDFFFLPSMAPVAASIISLVALLIYVMKLFHL